MWSLLYSVTSEILKHSPHGNWQANLLGLYKNGKLKFLQRTKKYAYEKPLWWLTKKITKCQYLDLYLGELVIISNPTHYRRNYIIVLGKSFFAFHFAVIAVIANSWRWSLNREKLLSSVYFIWKPTKFLGMSKANIEMLVVVCKYHFLKFCCRALTKDLKKKDQTVLVMNPN